MSLSISKVTKICSAMDGEVRDPDGCERISEMLSRIGDKWTILIVRRLGDKPQRFNALRRDIGDISQKMLSTTLRNLERDGFVIRTVTPTSPPQVEYTLTTLGHSLLVPVQALAMWTFENMSQIETARATYAERTGSALSEAA
jgi:DNA-binding HxlR family transcriptional regulator